MIGASDYRQLRTIKFVKCDRPQTLPDDKAIFQTKNPLAFRGALAAKHPSLRSWRPIRRRAHTGVAA
jgi:hypothetical protein